MADHPGTLTALLLVAQLGAQQPGAWRPRRAIGEHFATQMVWDAARERLVFFGGGPTQFAGDTWERIGDTWTTRTPATSPAPRFHHTMVFDAVSRRVVLFGGLVGNAPVAETWEWDGVDWQQRQPPASPPARWQAMMAFDLARGRSLLFGGMDAAFVDIGDTWEFDGSTWTQATPAVSPPPREQGAMVFDVARQLVLLFGGIQGAAALGDTWAWNGTTWSQRNPTASPQARAAASVAYDDARQRVVVFGGWAGANWRLGDTWEWDGTTWSQPTTTVLAPRQWGLAAYDPQRQRTVVFGGLNNTTNFRDGLEWDGATWHTVPAVLEPPERIQAAMADNVGGTVLLFGGNPTAGGQAFGDTWEWRAAAWHQRSPATSPPGRRLAGMARDPGRQRVVLFGGIGTGLGTFGQAGDTWEWDGSTWAQRTPATGPSARSGHALAFDPVQGHVLLFGGAFSTFNTVSYFNDTWEWDGVAWTQQQTAASPPPRAVHALATDLARQRVVLFGGASSTPIGDTWEWNGATWTQATTAGPGPRFAHAMAFDAARGRSILFDGVGPQGLVDETWEWDGAVWTQVATTAAPPARRDHAMAWDDELQRIVVCGGTLARSTWLFGRVDDASALPLGSGCPGSSGVPQLSANDPFVGNAACTVDLVHARALAPALVAFATASQAVPLGGGCTLHLRDAVPLFAPTSADGFAAVPLPLPFAPALHGARLYAQAGVLDPLGSLGGAALSAGLVLRLAD